MNSKHGDDSASHSCTNLSPSPCLGPCPTPFWPLQVFYHPQKVMSLWVSVYYIVSLYPNWKSLCASITDGASGEWDMKVQVTSQPFLASGQGGGSCQLSSSTGSFPNFDKSRFLLPLLNASLTSNCSSALPRGLIMRGEVHFLDHCSLAETSGTFLKEAT